MIDNHDFTKITHRLGKAHHCLYRLSAPQSITSAHNKQVNGR